MEVKYFAGVKVGAEFIECELTGTAGVFKVP